MKSRNIIFIIIITVITVITIAPGSVAAITPTAVPSKVSSPSATTIIDKLKQIEILKEKIATKVAQLRENEKGAISGTIKTIGANKVTLTTKSGESTISYSEDTIFFTITDGKKSDPQDQTFAKKLKAGDFLVAFGYYDSSRTVLTVKYIYAVNNPLHLIGKIADIDKNNFTISVVSPSGNTLIDIEKYTKIYLFNQKDGLLKSGFSRLGENDIVHIFAAASTSAENRVSALKIISFPFGRSPTPTLTIEKPASPTAKPTGK